MPPKRPRPTSVSSSSTPGDSKTPADASGLPPSKRWSAVSCSRNIDASYKLITKDAAEAYSYECICQLPDSPDDDESDEWETEDEDEGENENEGEEVNMAEAEGKGKGKDKNKPKCGTDRCVCRKPASDHPEHPYIVTMAGFQKFLMQHAHMDLRIPDLFDMYTFNDHAGHGCLEVLQNLMIDFVEAEGNWREQWSICEATGLILLRANSFTPLSLLSCPETLNATIQLIGRMFLTVLAKLERHDVLKPDSEVKNIGLMIAVFLKVADLWREGDILRDEDETQRMKRCPGKTFKFNPAEFDSYIYAYADKYKIPVHLADGVKDLIDALSEEAELPDAADDPWKWTLSFRKYKREFGEAPILGKPIIGGDGFDITSWSSAERKSHNFDKKDPLSKAEIKALKDGHVLQMG